MNCCNVISQITILVELSITNTAFKITADPGGTVNIRCAIYPNTITVPPTAIQVNDGKGNKICNNTAYTTEDACINVGNWSGTACNITSGGRETDESTCEAPASIWRDSEVGESNGPVVAVLASGNTNQGDAHTFAYTNLDENTNYDISLFSVFIYFN